MTFPGQPTGRNHHLLGRDCFRYRPLLKQAIQRKRAIRRLSQMVPLSLSRRLQGLRDFQRLWELTHKTLHLTQNSHVDQKRALRRLHEHSMKKPFSLDPPPGLWRLETWVVWLERVDF